MSVFLASTYDVSVQKIRLLFLLPVVLTCAVISLFIFPSTEKFGFWLMEENAPVELLTFIIFLISGVYGIYTVRKFKAKITNYTKWFYLVFAVSLIFISMEEISWGQWFFHFETPEKWAEMNGQQETTLHNLNGMQGHSEILRILFGFGGIIGVALSKFKIFKSISAPSVLISWFIIILCHAALDLIQDRISISEKYDFAIVKTSEFIELLIAGSSFLYFWLNFRMIRKHLS